MEKIENNQNDEKKLPIKMAYEFLEENNLKNIKDELINIKPGKRSTSARRGLFLIRLEGSELLDNFINNYWAFGKTNKGKSQINYNKKFYYSYTGTKSNNTDKTIEVNKKSKSAQIKKNQLEQSIKANKSINDEQTDNVVSVKKGFRILLGVLEPVVVDGLKQEYTKDWWEKGVLNILHPEQKRDLIKGKLDITLCFTLLVHEKHWDKIYKNKVKSNCNSKKVNSTIKGLKVDRNINAHDLLEDISFNETELTLKSMSFLCNAFNANEASGKIERIIKTLK